MSPTRFREVVELCERARALAMHSEDPGILTLCGGDRELATEAAAMLRGDSASDAESLKPILPDEALGCVWDETREEARGLASLERIGPFHVTALLGHGGGGVVYRAVQKHPSREVAIKVLREPVASGEASTRFRREADLMARLRHPGIASVYEAGVAVVLGQDRPYLVMELVEGRTLTQWAEAEQPSFRARVGLFLDICRAIEHAHARGVIHRDLKPANIVVEGEGRESRARVVDFGIAVEHSCPTLALSDRSAGGGPAGTRAYMSPEQAAGDERDVDTRSDVYSLGVVLFELLTGVLPAPGSDVASRFEPACRGDLDAILRMSLLEDREERYRSVALFREDLQRWLAHRPVTVRRASLPYVASRALRRHPLAAALAGAALAALGVGIAGLGAALRQTQAIAQRDAASLERVAGLLEKVVSQIEASVGATTTREWLLRSLIADITSLRVGRERDPVLLDLWASTLLYLSDVQQETGRTAEALANRLEALGVRRDLARQRPSDTDVQSELALALVKVGDLTRVSGRDVEGVEMYREALAIHESLAARVPRDRRVLDDLVWARLRVAAAVGGSGFAGAESGGHLDRALEDAERLAQVFPDDPRSWHALAAARHMWAERMARVDRARAIAILERAGEAARRAVAGSTRNRVFLERLAAILVARGAALTREEQLDSAARDFAEAEQTLITIGELDPTQGNWRVLLVYCHTTRAEALRPSHPEVAIRWSERALEVAMEGFPGGAVDRTAAEAILPATHNLAAILDACGRPDEAVPHYLSAADMAERAADPTDAARLRARAEEIARSRSRGSGTVAGG